MTVEFWYYQITFLFFVWLNFNTFPCVISFDIFFFGYFLIFFTTLISFALKNNNKFLYQHCGQAIVEDNTQMVFI